VDSPFPNPFCTSHGSNTDNEHSKPQWWWDAAGCLQCILKHSKDAGIIFEGFLGVPVQNCEFQSDANYLKWTNADADTSYTTSDTIHNVF
jgi:hypothetical protein